MTIHSVDAATCTCGSTTAVVFEVAPEPHFQRRGPWRGCGFYQREAFIGDRVNLSLFGLWGMSISLHDGQEESS